MQLFYKPELKSSAEVIVFDREETKHIRTVLRMKNGEKLFATNGYGLLVEGVIREDILKQCYVEVIEEIVKDGPRYVLHLAVAPTKMNERFEWFLEKCTEIGVCEITPIICERSERRIINKDRFNKVLISAMKQSEQCFLPMLYDPISFNDFVKQKLNYTKYIAHCAEGDKKLLKSALKIGGPLMIMIGPEGDFSNKEIELAIENKFQPVSLGESRLRTETAAVVACHSVAFFYQ